VLDASLDGVDMIEGRSKERLAFIRGKIIAISKAILKEEIGIIAGSRILTSLGYELYEGFDSQKDEDFMTFVVIDSDTDHLPVDYERRNWSVKVLERKDKEIAEYEAKARDDTFAACRNLIERFDMKDGI
jgi:hypothetical protein